MIGLKEIAIQSTERFDETYKIESVSKKLFIYIVRFCF